jgi:hypothetical protein
MCFTINMADWAKSRPTAPDNDEGRHQHCPTQRASKADVDMKWADFQSYARLSSRTSLTATDTWLHQFQYCTSTRSTSIMQQGHLEFRLWCLIKFNSTRQSGSVHTVPLSIIVSPNPPPTVSCIGPVISRPWAPRLVWVIRHLLPTIPPLKSIRQGAKGWVAMLTLPLPLHSRVTLCPRQDHTTMD